MLSEYVPSQNVSNMSQNWKNDKKVDKFTILAEDLKASLSVKILENMNSMIDQLDLVHLRSDFVSNGRIRCSSTAVESFRNARAVITKLKHITDHSAHLGNFYHFLL